MARTVQETRKKVDGITDFLAEPGNKNKQQDFKKLKGSALLTYVTADKELTDLKIDLLDEEDFVNIVKDNEVKGQQITLWFR